MRPCTTRVQRPRSSGWRSSPAPAAGWARRSCSGWPPMASRVATCDLAPAEGSALHGELDVVDRAAVGAFVARVEAELGAPGVVVTAAGVQRTGSERDGRGGGLEARHRREPHGHLERDPGGAAGDARAAQRAHRHALLGDRPRRPGALRGLRGVQGRRDRADQGAGARARSAGHLRQQRRAGTDRGRHAAARGGLQRRLAGRARAARGAGAARARWPRRWPSWPATMAATTWVRSSRPTAGPSSDRWTARPIPSSASSATGSTTSPRASAR